MFKDIISCKGQIHRAVHIIEAGSLLLGLKNHGQLLIEIIGKSLWCTRKKRWKIRQMFSRTKCNRSLANPSIYVILARLAIAPSRNNHPLKWYRASLLHQSIVPTSHGHSSNSHLHHWLSSHCL